MADDHILLETAGRIADGEFDVDWGAITSSMPTPEAREIADELALVAQIAAGHRQLHQLLPAHADTPPSLTPDRARWGHLDLLNIVGRGSYGIVYRAWDTRLERLVALKLFHGAANPDEVMQEGRMLARMRHENVVSVYGADVIDGVAGIWMELVHGRTLENIVKATGPMPPREAAAAGADVARALATVHGAGLLHCDVKAQNVVRETGGRVVLMDLGAGRLAPEARDEDQVADVAGTPRYMAPELFRSGTSATRASDIYSLGVLLYYIASGRFPVDGRTLSELRRSHDARQVRELGEVVPGLPRKLVELVMRAIDPDPARRPASTQEMHVALQALAAEPGAATIRSFPWFATIPTLGVIAIAALIWVFRPTPPGAILPDANTLAVLPIGNLTGDSAKQYLADGLTEVLVAHLARVNGLQVASSASTSTVRELTNERAIAEKLGVRLLLAGAVVRADERISLSVKLTDPFAGRTIWGTEIERRPSDILAAPSEIANLVAARLALEAPARDLPAGPQPVAEAQEAFLRGVVALATAAGLPRISDAEKLFGHASALEPQWAEPLAYLALTQQYALELGDPMRRGERAEIVRSNAIRAINLDPSLPLSYTALAAVQAYHDWDFRAAEGTLRQGLTAHSRDGLARTRLSLLLAAMGRLDEAVREAERARDDESLVADRHANLAVIRYYARDYDRSLSDYERALAINEHFVPALVGRARLLLAVGRHDDAASSLEKASAVAPYPAIFALQAQIHMAANRPAEADALIQRLKTLETQGQFISIDNFAYIEGHRGRFDEAFRLIEEAIKRRMTNVVWLAVDPRADVLRGDPRFDRLVASMGILAR